MNDETTNNLEFFEKEILCLSIKDPRFKELLHVVESNQTFDEKCIKILIALLMDIDQEGYEGIIEELAYLHEKEIYKDEREMFVSILLCEITARRKKIIEELHELEIKKPILSVILPNEKEFKGEEDEDELTSLDPVVVRKIRKSKARTKTSYIISKDRKKTAAKKTRMSFKDKIISTLNEKKSFLVHQHSFPLPSGIKRIRIQKEFGEVISFIEEYVKERKLPVKVVIEDDKAKVLFNGQNAKRPKNLYMRKTTRK